jgi:hypothetical protein
LLASHTPLPVLLSLRPLPALITETIDNVSPVERSVQDDKGETYLLRIRPYNTQDNRIDGVSSPSSI